MIKLNGGCLTRRGVSGVGVSGVMGGGWWVVGQREVAAVVGVALKRADEPDGSLIIILNFAARVRTACELGSVSHTGRHSSPCPHVTRSRALPAICLHPARCPPSDYIPRAARHLSTSLPPRLGSPPPPQGHTRHGQRPAGVGGAGRAVRDHGVLWTDAAADDAVHHYKPRAGPCSAMCAACLSFSAMLYTCCATTC